MIQQRCCQMNEFQRVSSSLPSNYYNFCIIWRNVSGAVVGEMHKFTCVGVWDVLACFGDSSRDMNDPSELILRDGNEYHEIPLRKTKYDLVVCSYSLFELPSAKHRQDVILNLWAKCDGHLIVVQEGTRRGSQLVNAAIELILSLDNAMTFEIPITVTNYRYRTSARNPIRTLAPIAPISNQQRR
uniref:Uncharacterized protein n=1 Tax=Glossina austeni TaxID=7395 RepID=A0A1A9VP21_GLOAU